MNTQDVSNSIPAVFFDGGKFWVSWINIRFNVSFKIYLFFNLGRSEDEVDYQEYEIHTDTDFLITFKLKEKIRSEEISRDLTFKIIEPIENYCVEHRFYRGIPVYDTNLEPFNPNVNCVSNLGYVTYTLSFFKSQMYN